jgi:chromosome segregation ATPase
MTTTPTERLTAAEVEVEKIAATLAAARHALADLRDTITKERTSYLDASAAALLDGDEQPSRERLTALERQVPDAEDRVERVAAALPKAEQRARHAKADVLDADAAAVREETTRRQARIHELQPQVEAMQREISEHSAWIGNVGPVKTQALLAEAHRLRSTP